MNKRKLTKVMCTIAVAVLSATSLIGCGKKEAGNDNKTSEKVTINYALWNKSQEPALRKIADNFEASHSNIKVNLEVIPYKQYLTKLEVAAQGGSAPDVFWLNSANFIKYAKSGILMPLDENIKKDNVDMSVFPDKFVDNYKYEDKTYGMPKDWDTIGLYYNKEMFDKANVPYPDDTWDWSKLEEVAGKLTNKESGTWGIAASCTDQQGFFNTIFQSKGSVISDDKKQSGYDKPETINGIQCWVDLVNKGYSPTYQQMTDTKPEDLFASGKVAMIYAGSWMTNKFMHSESISGKINIAKLPKMEQRGNVMHGVSNVMYKNTKNPKEVWEFVKYLGSKEAGEILAKEASLIPAHKEALPLFYESYKDLNLKVFTDQVPEATWYPTSIDTMKWLTLQQEYMAKAWSGEMSAEEACKELAEKMNEVLKNEK